MCLSRNTPRDLRPGARYTPRHATASARHASGLRNVSYGRSRSRTGGLLRIREALCHLSYPPSGRNLALRKPFAVLWGRAERRVNR
jgi:hypothetical protein